MEVMSRIPAANVSVRTWATSSPWRRRRRNARGPPPSKRRRGACSMVVAEVDILLDQRNSLRLLHDDRLRQLCVGKSLVVLLTIHQHPLQEILDRVTLL